MCRTSLGSLERGQAFSGVEQVTRVRSQLLESLHKGRAGDQRQEARKGSQEEKGSQRGRIREKREKEK